MGQQNGRAPAEGSFVISIQSPMQWPFDLAILFLEVSLTATPAQVCEDLCAVVLITALFVIERNYNTFVHVTKKGCPQCRYQPQKDPWSHGHHAQECSFLVSPIVTPRALF